MARNRFQDAAGNPDGRGPEIGASSPSVDTPAVAVPDATNEAPSVPESYRVHPLLDPLLTTRQPTVARFWLSTYRRLARDPEAYERVLRSFSGPFGGSQVAFQDLESYLRDADVYLDDLLRLIPDSEAAALRPLPATRANNDLLGLLRAGFEAADARLRHEARRKLQLSKLLFDVDHCRTVRDGPRHRARFELLLSQELWSRTTDDREIEICCRLETESDPSGRLRVGVPPEDDARCWRFHVRRLAAGDGLPEIEIYHYRSRFKRESTPAHHSRLDRRGPRDFAEVPRWPGLGRRSGSILSKMIRRAIGDPHRVQDLLGAMFIVGDREQAYALETRLLDALGGPFRWRDRVDTLGDDEDRARLDTCSASGFRVLKKIVDIPMEDPTASSPYLFSVEIQIFPLEAYLRTLHDAHFASHAAYKRRQFLRDLLPLLFPSEIYP